jgi:hypothetical protein
MSDVPPNIQEFNTIAGLVFAQLYKAFPAGAKIDRGAIAGAMGAEGNDWDKHELPSGRQLDQMFKDTFSWLDKEGYIKAEANTLASADGCERRPRAPRRGRNRLWLFLGCYLINRIGTEVAAAQE